MPNALSIPKDRATGIIHNVLKDASFLIVATHFGLMNVLKDTMIERNENEPFCSGLCFASLLTQSPHLILGCAWTAATLLMAISRLQYSRLFEVETPAKQI